MIKPKITELWDYKIIRFGVVGCFNTVFDISLLLFFYKIVGLSEITSNTLSVGIAVTVSYFLNHRLVFRYNERYKLKSFLRFIIVTGVSIIIVQNLVIYFMTHLIWPVTSSQLLIVFGKQFMLQTVILLLSKLLAVAVGMVWNFLLYKYIVFPDSSKPDQRDEIVIV